MPPIIAFPESTKDDTFVGPNIVVPELTVKPELTVIPFENVPVVPIIVLAFIDCILLAPLTVKPLDVTLGVVIGPLNVPLTPLILPDAVNDDTVVAPETNDANVVEPETFNVPATVVFPVDESKPFVSDCQIETDLEILIPTE